jgi:hypothetical protein
VFLQEHRAVWGELNHSASEPAVELSRYRSEGRHCEPQTWARKFNRSRFPKGCTPSRSAPTRSSGGTGTATNSRCGKSAIGAGRSAADGTLGCWSGTKRIRRTFSGRWPEVRQCGLESVLGLGNPLYGVQEQIRLRDAPAFFGAGSGKGLPLKAARPAPPYRPTPRRPREQPECSSPRCISLRIVATRLGIVLRLFRNGHRGLGNAYWI